MNHHVVVGAGPVGTAIAELLSTAGERVTVVTRSPGPAADGVDRVALDASDSAGLTALTEGAAVLYNAANPRDYHRWATIWPPLADSLLRTAERTGAVLATVGNLYGYGPVTGPITEDQPQAATFTSGRVRARMSADAFAAHAAGRLRAVEVRASDYVGRGAYSHVNIAARSVTDGRTAWVIGDPDQPHTWTGTGDTARTLVAAASDPTTHGRAWHVPSNPPRTMREVLHELAERLGRPAPRVVGTPGWLVRAGGLVNGQLRAMGDVMYQHTSPYVMDDAPARRRFGIEATPWRELLDEVLGSVGEHTGAA